MLARAWLDRRRRIRYELKYNIHSRLFFSHDAWRRCLVKTKRFVCPVVGADHTESVWKPPQQIGLSLSPGCLLSMYNSIDEIFSRANVKSDNRDYVVKWVHSLITGAVDDSELTNYNKTHVKSQSTPKTIHSTSDQPQIKLCCSSWLIFAFFIPSKRLKVLCQPPQSTLTKAQIQRKKNSAKE